ncbi:MAG TPA: hypothetical protein EYG88_10050 [Desulfocapsa sulfexigens]|nr:hypothetical protein [Desulfocapsa sulfexigens]
MVNTNDLWEKMGDLEEDDLPHVLTNLFAVYEEKLKNNPDDKAASDFFKHLSRVLKLVSECNLNRR